VATVLNRTTRELRASVNTPDFPVANWIINPDLSSVSGFLPKHWIITGDVVSLMDQAARDAADVQETADIVAGERTAGKQQFDDERILKALALVILDEINILRSQHGLAARTKMQFANAIRSKVDTI